MGMWPANYIARVSNAATGPTCSIDTTDELSARPNVLLPTRHSWLGNRFNQLARCLIPVHPRRDVGLRDDSAEHPVLVDDGNSTDFPLRHPRHSRLDIV